MCKSKNKRHSFVEFIAAGNAGSHRRGWLDVSAMSMGGVCVS